MRAIFLALVFSAACATTGGNTHPTNVAHVRLQIQVAMQTQAPDRQITAMGHTTDDSAVVYTTSKSGARQEETWVRVNGAWKLDHSVAADGATSANSI